MNERIIELNREAQAFATRIWGDDEDYFNQWVETYKEKLAELIVKETMQVVANQLPSNQYLDVAHAVIEHFGVEE
jgi:hypothetical protein